MYRFLSYSSRKRNHFTYCIFELFLILLVLCPISILAQKAQEISKEVNFLEPTKTLAI